MDITVLIRFLIILCTFTARQQAYRITIDNFSCVSGVCDITSVVAIFMYYTMSGY